MSNLAPFLNSPIPHGYVRVKHLPTGHELSVTAAQFERITRLGLAFRRLDKPAAYPGGDPLPAKPRRTIAQAAALKKQLRKSRRPGRLL